MRKRALRKDFHMEMKGTLNRFLSIFFIVALGVAFYSGIQSSAPDMRATGDAYFDGTNLMDIRVMGTLGLTERDVEALGQVEGVAGVEPGYTTDVLCGQGELQNVLHVESLLSTMNQLTVTEGSLPTEPGTCFVDQDYLSKMGYQVGDPITLTIPDEENSILKTTSYVICGTGSSSAYLSYNKGSSTLGNGEVAGVMYVLPEDFDSEVYTVAYITVEGASTLTDYTDEYDSLINAVTARIEEIADVRCEARYQEVMEEATQKLEEHRADLEEGKQKLADARTDLENGKTEAESELSDAKEKLESGESELTAGRETLESSKQKLADAKAQLADGETQLSEKEAQLADAKAQLAEGESQMASAESALNLRQSEFDAAEASTKQQLADGQKQLNEAKASLSANRQQLEQKSSELDAAEQAGDESARTLESYQQQYDAGQSALQAAKQQQTAAEADLAEQQAVYESGAQTLEQNRPAIEQARTALAGLNASREEVAAAASSARTSADALRQQLEGENSSLQSQLEEKNNVLSAQEQSAAALESEIGAIDGEIASLQSQLEELRAQETPDQSQIDSLEAQLSGKQQERESKAGELGSVQTQIAQLGSEIETLNGTISSNNQQIQDAEAAAAQAETQLGGIDAQIAELTGQIGTFEQQESQLAEAKAQLDTYAQTLEESGTALSEKEAQLNQLKSQIDSGYQQLNSAREQIAAGREQIAQGHASLDQGESEIAQKQQQITAGQNQLAQGKQQLQDAWDQLNAGKETLRSSRSQVESGEAALSEGRQTLESSRQEIADGEQKLSEAESEIEKNQKSIDDGWKDYEDGKKEADQKIKDGQDQINDAQSTLDDAQQKIDDAQAQIDEIKMPEWYVQDRSALPEHAGYGENADRMTNIGRVFPVLFFLVAALISLTTMTRMVEEERTQIGTLKALGYGKKDIAMKYLKYALYATLGGSIFGILVGEKILPYIIIYAYGMMYHHIPQILVPYNWNFGLIAMGVALVCTLGATFSSCRRELSSFPAVLMRPPAPKEGKRVWVEYIPFLWKHLSFSWKSTVRNLLRYKKRFFMTIIGIGGCMGLLLVGFGLKDSIMDIAKLQYEQLQYYDQMVILNPDAQQNERGEVDDYLVQDQRIAAYQKIHAQKITVTDGAREYTPYLYVPETTGGLDRFMVFRDRTSHEAYQLNDDGVIITEKIAKMLGLKVGDKITLEDDDRHQVSVPITAVAENYLYHYVYMTADCYRKVYEKEPSYNSILVNVNSEVVEQNHEIGKDILALDGVLNVTYTDTISSQMEDMLGSLNIVVAVLIISAGMLAFVVLYNLNNININERRRELATIKVLGFYDREVDMYVYRENILLTIIGAGVGIGIGIFLHRFIMTTVEVDVCMFGRNINPPSYLYSTLFTFGFSFVINMLMHFKLKKIDMVESLKSVE